MLLEAAMEDPNQPYCHIHLDDPKVAPYFALVVGWLKYAQSYLQELTEEHGSRLRDLASFLVLEDLEVAMDEERMEPLRQRSLATPSSLHEVRLW